METALLIRGLACLMVVCGLWLLQAAWRLRTANGWRLAGGWSAITLSVICWAATSHPDKGSALGIVVIMIAAMAALSWIYVKADRKTAREATARVTKPAPTGPLEILRRIAAGILLGPLAGLAALAFSTAGFVVLRKSGVEHTTNLVTAMFAFPLLWAVIAVVASAHSRLWRKSAIVIGSAIAPFAYLSLSV
jgi:hypothetical protein